MKTHFAPIAIAVYMAALMTAMYTARVFGAQLCRLEALRVHARPATRAKRIQVASELARRP